MFLAPACNRQSQIDPIVTTLPPTRRACATHPYAQYCCGLLCLSEPAVRISPSALPGTSFFQSVLRTNPGWYIYLYHHLSPCCFFCVFLCDPTMPLLQLFSAQCANSRSRQHTMRIRQMRAALSVLQQKCLLLSSALAYLCTYIPAAVCDRHFLLRTDHLWIVCFHNQSVV